MTYELEELDEDQEVVGFADYDPLRGFWKTENAAPGPVRHLYGDPYQFRQDLVRSNERIESRLDKLENRFLLCFSWPDELLGGIEGDV